MKKILTGAAVALAMSLSAPVMVMAEQHIQVEEPSTEAAAKRALAEELMAIQSPDLDKQVLAYMAQMLRSSGLDEVDADFALWMEKNAGKILLPHLRTMMDQSLDIYVSHYTTDELRAAVDFYKTPMGSSIARKQVSIGIAAGELMQPIMVAYATDLMTQLCTALDCQREARPANLSGKSSRR